MNEVYEQYKEEHPEELQELNRLLRFSESEERRLAGRRKEKLKKIEECRRVLYSDSDK